MRTMTLAGAVILALVTAISADPIGAGQKLTLSLEDVPIAAALSMIAEQNELNLVVSGDVVGNVTLQLSDVDVATALDAILTANGYNFFLKDNVVIIKSIDADAAGELVSQVMTLKYLSPVTAEKALSSVKSAKGSVTILDRSAESGGAGDRYHANRIIVTDYPNVLDDLIAIVEEIDIPERSIMIEARIIETSIDSKSNLGLSWPTSLSARLSDADGAGSSAPVSTDGTIDRSAGVYEPATGKWTWGKLSVGEVSSILNMLEQDGNSRLVSDPRITTLENHEAEFRFQTVIPIQTISRFTEGAATSDIVTYQDEEIGISLKVVARINEDSRVTMDVEPTVEDILGYTGPTDNQKPITASRTIRTRVTVNDGETVALGGLLKEDEIENVQRVPLLGHIPLIGRLVFSSKSVEKKSTDLLILITPHILD